MAGNDADHLPPPLEPPLTQVAKEAPTARLGIDFLRSEESRMERSLHTAMNQICVLNRGMSQLLVRYNRTSVTSGRRAHRYHLRLRMAVFEGVRAMYYEYAIGQTEELNSIRDAIKNLASSQQDSDSDDLVENQRADNASRPDSSHSRSNDSQLETTEPIPSSNSPERNIDSQSSLLRATTSPQPSNPQSDSTASLTDSGAPSMNL